MFCFQCQETMKNTGCSLLRGMCGKNAETSDLQDRLLQKLKQVALLKKQDRKTGVFLAHSLFMTITNANFDPVRLESQIAAAEAMLGGKGNPSVPLGVPADRANPAESLRELITYGLKGLAAYTDHAAVLGFYDDEIFVFIFKALAALAVKLPESELLSLVLECGHTALRAMALLDDANTKTFGNPVVSQVRTGAGKNPGILVSGHDLLDLKELLEQTVDSGIDIYTHGEMLPAHAYPIFKKYKHLYGNSGGSWYLQNREFASFNGPILMTTNCITPVPESYRERIFTTGAAGYPGVAHIPDRLPGKKKDFSRLIELAKHSSAPLELKNGELTVGFAHSQITALSERIAEAVKKGRIKRFIVMAGCDGRHDSRVYYTHVARKLPADTVILTAGCAKYRYNKLNLGEIDGIPRVLDAGQCNDSYSLAVAALNLKTLFHAKSVNELPISFDIAWYEQKAVAVLLALLALGFKNIRLGPTLPAFLSPGVLQTLVEKFDLKPIGTPELDVSAMMKGL